jgi:hypothetical protein
MKSSNAAQTFNRRGSNVVKAMALSAAFSTACIAAPVTLIDGNSELSIDPASSAGVNSWLVEGQQQLFTQWFWYRVGDVGTGTREYSIDTLSAPTVTSSATSATIAYSGSLFDISVTYLLGGGTVGSGQSVLNEDILIVNKSGAALDLQFFQYSDFDLAGTAGGDSVLLDPSTSPFELAYQWDGNIGLTEGIVTINPFAGRGDVGFAPSIVSQLNDGGITDLSNTAGPIGPGDVEFAFQWDLAIGAGDSVTISKIKDLNVYVIPEPTTAALSLLGLGFFAVRRMRRGSDV